VRSVGKGGLAGEYGMLVSGLLGAGGKQREESEGGQENG
jgi:hypothetical protein